MAKQRANPSWTPGNANEVLVHGILGGILGGIAFTIAEVALTALTGLPPLTPIRTISAVALGPTALYPDFPLVQVFGAFVVVQAIVSTFWGLVFALLISVAPMLSQNSSRLLLSGLIFGTFVWLIDFYLIGPFLFPWIWLANPWIQFVAHTFFFGGGLALYFLRLVERRTASYH